MYFLNLLFIKIIKIYLLLFIKIFIFLFFFLNEIYFYIWWIYNLFHEFIDLNVLMFLLLYWCSYYCINVSSHLLSFKNLKFVQDFIHQKYFVDLIVNIIWRWVNQRFWIFLYKVAFQNQSNLSRKTKYF